MNKKLIAAALAGAFIAPVAMAEVQIYGAVDVSVESVSANGAANSANDVNSRTRVTSNTSKIGFKGSEDLGSGLKAIWQVEQGVQMDGSGTDTFATRNSFVGLEGGFGKVLAGRHDSAYKTLAAVVNPLPNGVADICGGGTTNALFCRGATRMVNSAHYFSPSFSGFSAGMSYGTDEARTADTNKDVYSLAVQYKANGVHATVGYEKRNDSIAKGYDTDLWQVGANYTFGDTTVGAGFERQNDQRVGMSDKTQNSWTVGAKHKMGAIGLGLAYVKLNESESNAKDDASQWTLAATYDLSKATMAYGYFTRIDNNDGAARNFALNSLATGVAAGSNPTAFGVGLRHSF